MRLPLLAIGLVLATTLSPARASTRALRPTAARRISTGFVATVRARKKASVEGYSEHDDAKFSAVINPMFWGLLNFFPFAMRDPKLGVVTALLSAPLLLRKAAILAGWRDGVPRSGLPGGRFGRARDLVHESARGLVTAGAVIDTAALATLHLARKGVTSLRNLARRANAQIPQPTLLERYLQASKAYNSASDFERLHPDAPL
jgi:hypothetical protein